MTTDSAEPLPNLGNLDEPDSLATEQTKTTDIKAPSEVPLDTLSTQEKKRDEIENRSQRIGNDLLQQKSDLQKQIFWIAVAFICVFYIVFILTVVSLVITHGVFAKGFPVTATVLIGMTGSIPTILTGFLMVGLFSGKEQAKEQEVTGSLPDAGTVVKACIELSKHLKAH